jgi:hypothetical protein
MVSESDGVSLTLAALPGVGKPAMVVVRVPMLGFWLKGIKKFGEVQPHCHGPGALQWLDSGQ